MSNALSLLREIAETLGAPSANLPSGYRMAGEDADAEDMLADAPVRPSVDPDFKYSSGPDMMSDHRMPTLDPGTKTIAGETPNQALPAELFIRYEDVNGNVSLRSITMRGVSADTDGAVLLRCFCHLRGEPRIFRAGRILDAVDSVTGKHWEPPTGFLRYWGEAKTEEAPADGTLEALKSARHGVIILTFLAQCDGRQDIAETEIIIEYLLQYAYKHEINPERLAEFMSRLKPDKTAFLESAEALASGNGETTLENVLVFAGRLIQADGVLHDNEREFAARLMSFRQTGNG